MNSSPFGTALARARRRVGFAQTALADRAGVSTRHLSFLETGRSRPSRAMVERLASALGLDGPSACELRIAAGFSPAPATVLRTLPPGPAPLDDRQVRTAFDAAVALQEVDSLDAATELAAKGLAELGIFQFATGTLRMGLGGAEIRFDPVGKPAVGWMTHCVQQGYRECDPFIKRTAGGSGAFVWADVIEEGLTPEGRRIVGEAGEFGIAGGFVLPLRRSDGSVRALTSWTGHPDISTSQFRAAARLVASALLDVAERLSTTEAAMPSTPGLPPQSRSILSWITAGRDIDWIARRLCAADEDILRAISNACAEMGSDEPWQAISRATAMELISP